MWSTLSKNERLTLAAAGIASVLSLVAITRSFDVVTHGDAPAVIKDTLVKNPDIIMQAVKQLREKQNQEGKKDVNSAFAKHKAELFTDGSPSVGPADADIVIAEFFDYHCGYCKKMLPVIAQLLREDKKVRVVFREFPILSEDSIVAARAALAFYKLNKDKYFEFHTALMGVRGKFDDKLLGEMAQRFGVGADQLKQEMAKPEYTAALEKNRQIADDFGIRGTPALLIGDQLLPGAISYADMKKVVADTRAAKK